MKRFYKAVTTLGDVDGGFVIRLDGKEIKTPAGKTMLAPNKKLADAIAAEWDAQKEDITPDAMPLTQLLTTALDRIAQDGAGMRQQILGYIDTDLICYRAPEPEKLVSRQEEAWDRWIEWFSNTYEGQLNTTDSIKAIIQPSIVHQKIHDVIEDMDDLHFSVFQLVTSMSGSVVLALAFMKWDAPPELVFEAMYVEEDYKAGIYNEDVHGLAPHEETKRKIVMRELLAAREFLDLL